MQRPVRILLSTTCLSALLTFGVSGIAQANPEDGIVSAGQASITADGKTLNVHQQSNKAVIDWRNFDIGHDETTNFYQPGKTSVTLNRVHSSQASRIDGKLNANGNIIIVNQNGVVFGAGSQVDVHGIVASTADIDNDRFMTDDKLRFDKPGQAGAAIVNKGTITAREAGLVGFVAPNVSNEGVISARMGRVHLASGSTATIDFYGDGLMEVEVDDSVQSQVVSHTGSIDADGGTIVLTAAAGGQIVHGLINAKGAIRAQSVGQKNGKIIISAAGSNAVAGNVTADKGVKTGTSRVVVSSTIDASGTKAGERGGQIEITADDITVEGTARLNASGDTGGGDIKIGGDYQGKGDTETAKLLTVETGAVINNDAVSLGDAGRTILWSDGDTSFKGTIIARGGADGGKGGFAEVSGHETLLFSGLADLSALSDDDYGTLLLDPTDITISNAPDSNMTGTTAKTGTAATSNLNITTLQNQLAVSNVSISTASAFAGNGDITLVDPLAWTANRTLSLNATRDIVFNSTITLSSGNNVISANAGRDIVVNSILNNLNSGSMTFTAGQDIAFNANVTVRGAANLSATAGRHLTVAAGTTLTSGNTGQMVVRAANGNINNTGLLTLNGRLNAGSSNFTLLSGVDGANRANLTLDSTTFTQQGASIGSTSITGFNDVTVNTAMTASNTVTIAAQNDLNVNSAITTSGNGGIAGSASRDINVNANMAGSGTGGLNLTASRHLTVDAAATVASGAGGGLSLRAAGANVANTGLLTMNGRMNAGTGAFTLLSGVNGANRSNITLNNSTFGMLGATVGVVSLTGFNDMNFDNALVSSSNVTIAGQRHVNVGSTGTIETGTSGVTVLTAGGGSQIVEGVLVVDGLLKLGTGNVTLRSGLTSSNNRVDFTLDNTNFQMLGASVGNFNVAGFRDFIFDTNLTSTGGTTIVTGRDITINAGSTLSSNATTLNSTFYSSESTGVVKIDGRINAGAGALSLTSGRDGSNNLADLTLNSSNFTQQGASVASVSIGGFRDISLATNLTSAGSSTLSADRNLTIESGSTIRTAANTYLYAAGSTGNSTNTAGTLLINGTVNAGTGELRLISGSLGSTTDLTIDNSKLVQQGASIGTTRIYGFRDLTFDDDYNFTGALSATALRDLTIQTGTTIASQDTKLYAANNNIANVGMLRLNGRLNNGTSGLMLTSGTDGSGGRADLLLDSTHFGMTGASVGSTNIVGFRDITLDTDLISSNSVVITAERNLTVNAGRTLRNGLNGFLANFGAAGGNINNQGVLTLSGLLDIGASIFSLSSGLDSSNNRHDLTLNSSTFNMQNPSGLANILIQGFRDITLDTDVITQGGNTITAERNLTLNAGATLQSSAANFNLLKAAGGNINNVGLLTLNGLVNNGTGNLTLLSGVDSSGNRTDLTLDNSNLGFLGASVGNVSITGFRDLTVDTTINSSSTVLAQAGRDMIIGIGGSTSSAGNTTLVAGRNFINNASPSAVSSSGGRWLVYATDPRYSVTGSLPYDFIRFSCSYGGSCGTIPAGDGFLYSSVDPDSISAQTTPIALPDTVVKVTQDPLLSYTSSPNSAPSTHSQSSDEGDETDTDMNADIQDITDSENGRKATLIFDPELAKRLKLKNWYF